MGESNREWNESCTAGLDEGSDMVSHAPDIDSVDIRDDFMFSYVMCNRQICTELLQCLLPEHKISRIEYYELGEDGTERPEDSSNRYAPLKIDTQKALAEAFNKRGVRLDVYIDDGKSVYNVEMQTTKQPVCPSARGCIRRTSTSTNCGADSTTMNCGPVS